MFDLADHLLALPILIKLVIAAIFLLLLAFCYFFLFPWWGVKKSLEQFSSQLAELKKTNGDPRQLKIAGTEFDHLWSEFCETLHLPRDAIDPATGMSRGQFRATVPAEAYFNPQTVFEGRMNTEFFKHVPGLLTGLGIIGTFIGLIDGLGKATGQGGAINTSALIASVNEAFHVSAWAIFFAMLVTFIEKVLVTKHQRSVEGLCQQIDALYTAGAGEEYLSRLVSASEDSATQSKILKDSLVGELKIILERLTERQIDASNKQQHDLQRNLVGAIEQGLRQPLDHIAQGFSQFQNNQGEQLTESLKDSMAAFAEKLDQMLGGQIGQARELQMQTVQVLQSAVVAFKSMAEEVGNAGQATTAGMVGELTRVLDDMARRQDEMNLSMRAMNDELRASTTQSQNESQTHLSQLLDTVGQQVASVVGRLQDEADAATSAQRQHLTEMASHAQGTLDGLAESVRVQSAAIGDVASAVKSAVADLRGSVDRNVSLMGEGASRMREAAEKFSSSGLALNDIFGQSKSVTASLSETAASLRSGANEVQTVVADYRAARESFETLVDGLTATIDTAKRDASMTSQLISQLKEAADGFGEAQEEAEDYISKLNDVLVEAHKQFREQLLGTVKSTNDEFHQHLANTTSLLASTIADLDGTIVEFSPRKQLAG